jgi:hypothetical protein
MPTASASSATTGSRCADARPGDRLFDAIGVEHVLLVGGTWLLLNVASLALVLRVTLALPDDYFEADAPVRTRWTIGRVGRNLAGVVLILVGAALSIPGVPGQGLLTVLAGVLLVDFPGRQRLERLLVGRRGVLLALNRLRARFGRPPLRPPRG